METIWVVLGSSGQYSDWTQWLCCAYADEIAAKDEVVRLTQETREHWAARPDGDDMFDEDGDATPVFEAWQARCTQIDPQADEYDEPHYTARPVPFRPA